VSPERLSKPCLALLAGPLRAAAAHPSPGSASEGPPGTGAPTGANDATDQDEPFRTQQLGTEDAFLALDSPNRVRRVKGALRASWGASAISFADP